ncbi:hypothetical protein [Comamonas terrigena]|uniref:hypothetical protein n=1 Tax=Comamonas terrigena TaxID=32013 RepID=UPI002353B7ED|nr:hypothetical protein [Comamonas terrigena]
MSKQEKVAVKFLKHWRGYNPGETAGFDAAQAERLVDGKVAEKAGGTGAAASPQSSGRGRKSDGGEKGGGKASTAADAASASAVAPAASSAPADGSGDAVVDDARP